MTNRIELIDDSLLAPEGFLSFAEKVAESALETEGIENAYASLMLVTGEEIRRLNREMRGVDAETDVLSFPAVAYPAGKTAKSAKKRLLRAFDPSRGQIFLGDIALNLSRAREQAAEFGHSVEREMGYLTAHALFHLMGYDHMTEDDKKVMREMEKRAMDRLKLYKDAPQAGNEKETEMTDSELKSLAVQALDLSYSPYSRFRVGACLLSENGRVFLGANFENASYGAAICAERCAVSNAIAHGVKRFTKIAIACDNGFAWPCGICRQVLNEFKAGDMTVMTGSPSGEWKELPLSKLLPESFGPEDLGILK